MKRTLLIVLPLFLLASCALHTVTEPVEQQTEPYVEPALNETELACVDSAKSSITYYLFTQNITTYEKVKQNSFIGHLDYLRAFTGFPFSQYHAKFVGEDNHVYEVFTHASGFAASGADMQHNLCIKKDSQIIVSESRHGRDPKTYPGSCEFNEKMWKDHKVYCDLTLGSL